MNHTETLCSAQLCVGEIPRRASPPRDDNTGDATDLMPLKELNRSLVFLGCGLCLKRSQIPALSRFRILLLGVQAIFTGLQFPDHLVPISNLMT
jgi:hypothetical protein